VSVVLITGVAGFMGSHLADEFLAKGYLVKGIDNFMGGYASNVPSGVDFLEADLDDLEVIESFFENVDLVVHAACTAYEGLSVFSPALISRNTFQISANVISSSIKHKVRKFVFMSSMARYGTQDRLPFIESMRPMPQDPYGISKVAAEMLLKNMAETHGMEYVVVVPHNIIGPRQKYDDPFRNVASIMINRMLQGRQPIIYGDGNQKRCFSFMNDVTQPILRACEFDDVNGLTINIGPDEEFITINELAKRIAAIINFDLDPIFLPGRPQEVLNANCSADLAREVLDYKTTTSLDDGLKELIGWIKSSRPKRFDYHLPIEFVTDRTPLSWTKELFNE
jgi:UDP-glucose 4-epimerase